MKPKKTTDSHGQHETRTTHTHQIRQKKPQIKSTCK